MKRVVVTGLGAITPIGLDTETFWNHLKKGQRGIAPITHFDTRDFTVKLAAEVKEFDVQNYMDKKNARKYDPFSQFAVAAAKEALVHSGLNMEKEDADRIGVFIGSGIGGLGTLEQEVVKLHDKGPHRVSALMIPKIITNMASGNVAIEIGAKGVNAGIVSACASGTHAIGEAYRNIQFGQADVIFCGGAESCIVPVGVAGFANMTALSTSTDPDFASRPFDKNRDGFVMGEGAGVLVLESYEHAMKRDAVILAEIVGYGATCDAYHITTPDPNGQGAAKAMALAIKDAGITCEQIDYINAHGTSTRFNDFYETLAIKRTFGAYAHKVKINSTKSMTGHLLGAAGGIESVAVVKSLMDQYIHPTMGFTERDEECDLDYLFNNGIQTRIDYALSNSLGFGGHNATIIFKRGLL